MINVLLGILLLVYVCGAMYTAIIFWRYGLENSKVPRKFYEPVPASITLALLWPVIMGLMYFSKDK